MGEIGIMVSRLQQEGFDLEDMIDDELRAAGFLELCERTTRTLLQRAVAVEESHSSLRRLLDSIDVQLQEFQGTRQTPRVSGKDVADQQQQQQSAAVIVIDDDEAEFVDVSDMSCQATFEDIENETRDKDKEEMPNTSQNNNLSVQRDILQNYVPIRPAPVKESTHTCNSGTLQTATSSVHLQTISKQPDVVSSVTSAGKTPPVIYRTLKSPVVSGVSFVPQRVALKSSPPSLPVQQAMSSLKSSTATASSLVSPGDNRSSATPSSVSQPSSRQTPSPQAGPSSADRKTSALNRKRVPLQAPLSLMLGLVLLVKEQMNYGTQKIKYKVKFDKGARGLLSSNHISLETNPNASVLNVGSRVVGIYGKLDVLYAGIVAENACNENKNRFLVFFDDGFAQYLPVKKLHHVYHTGKKVWDEVAEHSKEFIQEYLEEFPNRPMVKLKVHSWVKTEWRGQWLKAKVMQLDCSLVKMLFQIDNRSEWLYRGSTRIEPLYSALVDGKISTAKKKRSRKLTRGASGKTQEPFIDYSITKPCLGVSPYSKTDPLGEQQRKLEEKRQQTQLEQQRQQEQQEQLRDENKKLSTTTTTSTPPPGPSQSTSTVTATSSTITSATGTVGTPTGDTGLASDSKGISDSSMSRTEPPGPSSERHRGPDSGSGSGTQASGSFQSSSANQLSSPVGQDSGTDCQSRTGCEGGHCSGLPDPGLKDGGSSTNADNAGCGCCTDSSMSVIQASNVRKKTSAGLVIPRDHLQRPNGIEVIDLDGDGTTAMLHVPMESDQIMSSLTAHKNEYLGPNMDGSILEELYNAWEAPWLRTNRRDARSTGYNRVPAFQIPANNRRKQDVASLIQERLKQNNVDKMPVGQCEGPGLPVLSKPTVKGPHKCSNVCNSPLSFEAEESVKHNPRAIPLLLKWKREIAQRHPGNKKTVYYRTPCNKRLRSMLEVANYLTITYATNVSIDQFTFDTDICCQDTVFRDVDPICPDISRGEEIAQISVVNEVDTCFPPPIDYISRRILAEGVNMVLDPGFLACCDCTDNCQDKSKCSCAQLTIQASAAVGGKEDPAIGYEFRRLKDCVQTGIYECNQNCACGSQCFNRVVQNGIQLRLQVFKTENRGWGLRSLDDIPMGTFVCTYAGQILNEDMANKEGRDFGDEYLAELDHIEVVEKAKEGYESNVSDLEEDDSVIYQALGADSSSSGSASGSGESSLSEDDSSDVDSLLSEESYSSGRNSRHGDSENTIHKPSSRRKKRKRSGRKSDKKKREHGEETLMVERESKAHCLSHLADEKWCYIALKRNHDDQKEAAAF
ncbi:Histone-lysine N-methyltransferase [Desmophyllum pertusum]|uniref:Histone-lysine N-methyltransferase n=1 Tax=Desmophyllum pertusum TaxID=174260 RepID=A0A9X0CSA1_9CNID|nr:Histone-lysine N-methyltransferase [Desmophyllum pertusum]